MFADVRSRRSCRRKSTTNIHERPRSRSGWGQCWGQPRANGWLADPHYVTFTNAERASHWHDGCMKPEAIFFLVGGFLFLLVALFLRELNNDVANGVAFTFGLIGFFWMVPQLVIYLMRRGR